MDGKTTLWDSLTARVQTVPLWCRQAFIFLVSFIILVSRRPDAVFRPQFWAEDGWLFYTQAYNAGLLHPLFWTYSGYLHAFPRLASVLAQFLPFIYAPLLFNLLALTVQILPVQMLFCARLSAIGNLPARLSLALLYLSLPNSFEVHATISNAHWHLAIIAFLVIMSSPPQNMVSKVLDYLAVLMCGLTGPFAIMLSPTAFLAWRKGRDRWKLILTSTLLASAGVQGTLIFFADRSARMKEPLGANLASLIEMLADHVFLGALVVRNIFVHTHPLGALVVATLGIATVLYGLIRGPLPLKFFILFAGLVLACSLASPITWPMVNGVAPRPRVSEWQALVVGGGQRYWYLPMLAFVATLVWLLKPTTPAVLHLLAIFCFVVLPFGVARDWHLQAPVDLHFEEYSQEFNQAPVGTVLVIPVNPPGQSMRLVKHWGHHFVGPLLFHDVIAESGTRRQVRAQRVTSVWHPGARGSSILEAEINSGIAWLLTFFLIQQPPCQHYPRSCRP